MEDFGESLFLHTLKKLQELLQLSKLLFHRFEATFVTRWPSCICLPTFLVATLRRTNFFGAPEF
jgi:hypothetical protein